VAVSGSLNVSIVQPAAAGTNRCTGTARRLNMAAISIMVIWILYGAPGA
jgi:hypothetical protein